MHCDVSTFHNETCCTRDQANHISALCEHSFSGSVDAERKRNWRQQKFRIIHKEKEQGF